MRPYREGLVARTEQRRRGRENGKLRCATPKESEPHACFVRFCVRPWMNAHMRTLDDNRQKEKGHRGAMRRFLFLVAITSR